MISIVVLTNGRLYREWSTTLDPGGMFMRSRSLREEAETENEEKGRNIKPSHSEMYKISLSSQTDYGMIPTSI